MLQTKKGIVLKRFPYSESNIGIHLLLESGQLLFLTAHGLLSSKKRSALIAEPGSYVSITYYEHSHSTGSLKEGNVIDDFQAAKTGYESLLLLSHLLELTERATGGGSGETPDLFILLYGAEKEVAKSHPDGIQFGKGAASGSGDGSSRENIRWLYVFLCFYKIRLLKILGLLADTSLCSSCGGPIGSRAAWRVPEVYFFCENCSGEATPDEAEMARAILEARGRRFRTFASLLPNPDEVSIALFRGMDRRLEMALEHFFAKPLNSARELYEYLGR